MWLKGNFCAWECELLQPHLIADIISSFFAEGKAFITIHTVA